MKKKSDIGAAIKPRVDQKYVMYDAQHDQISICFQPFLMVATSDEMNFAEKFAAVPTGAAAL